MRHQRAVRKPVKRIDEGDAVGNRDVYNSFVGDTCAKMPSRRRRHGGVASQVEVQKITLSQHRRRASLNPSNYSRGPPLRQFFRYVNRARCARATAAARAASYLLDFQFEVYSRGPRNCGLPTHLKDGSRAWAAAGPAGRGARPGPSLLPTLRRASACLRVICIESRSRPKCAQNRK